MDKTLRLDDVRESVLGSGPFTIDLSTRLNDFFQFSNWNRSLSDPAPLKDCFFYDLCISPDVPAKLAPDYGLFAECFPAILARLVGESGTLALYVKSSDPEFFEEFNVIRTILAPRGLRYILLSEARGPDGLRRPGEVGNLVFEWPLVDLDYVVKRWFMCPQVSIEGYVATELPLRVVSDLYFSPDTEARIRQVLRTVDLAFRLWPDNDGLFILTDKVDKEALQSRLRLSEFKVYRGAG
jgi:hypothetical protein